MIRFIGLVIFLFLYFILGLPVLGIEWILHMFAPTRSDYRCLRIVQWGFRTILSITGAKITVIGEDRIPDEPVLFVGNHRSYFDILITYSRCKRLTGYIAKVEMLRYPILRIWMKRVYCLFLDRNNTREGLKTILEAIEYIKRGISICIFPEGTRNNHPEHGILPFHNGSFKIAEKSGCAIVPICLNNTEAIFEKQFPRIKKAHVILEYGEPIYMSRMEKEEKKKIGDYCHHLISETIQKNEALL